MSLPSSYKRAVFKEAGAPLTVEEVELVAPGAGEILVKIEACGVCASDHFAQAYGMAGQLSVLCPFMPLCVPTNFHSALLTRATNSSAVMPPSEMRSRSGKQETEWVVPGTQAMMVGDFPKMMM